jgi:hypothetical protein
MKLPKLSKEKITEYRPAPYPCWTVYEKTTWYLFGLIPIRSKLKKIK